MCVCVRVCVCVCVCVCQLHLLSPFPSVFTVSLSFATHLGCICSDCGLAGGKFEFVAINTILKSEYNLLIEYFYFL